MKLRSNTYMKQKYRLTGFARFILFLAFFVPVSYFGITIFNGEQAFKESITALKDKLLAPKTEKIVENTPTNCDEIIRLKEKEIEILRAQVQELQRSERK